MSSHEAKRYAVFISVANYDEDGFTPYDTIRASAEQLKNLFDDSDMWDSSEAAVDPVNHWEFMKPIDEAVALCKPGDTILVYYVGHADHLRRKDQYGDIHLSLRSSKQRKEWSYLALHHVYDALRNAKADSKVLILDCCNCGSAGMLSTQPEFDEPGYIRNLDRGTSTCVLKPMGVQDMDQSTPSTREGDDNYTEFTGALIDILTHGIPRANNKLTTAEVARELTHRLSSPDRQPESAFRGSGAIFLLDNKSDEAGQDISADADKLTTLSPADLADMWTGTTSKPLRVSHALVKEHIVTVIVPQGAKVQQLAHQLHSQIDTESPQHVDLIELIRDNKPDVIGRAMRHFSGSDCAACRKIAEETRSWAIHALSPDQMMDFYLTDDSDV